MTTTAADVITTTGTNLSTRDWSSTASSMMAITTTGMSSGSDGAVSSVPVDPVERPTNLSVLTTTEVPNVIVTVSSTAQTIIAIYMGFLCFFGILNNGLVLFLYFKNFTKLHNPVNFFLINISIGDLTVSVFGSPFMFASTVAGYWLFGSYGCTWYAFITTVGGCEQIVSLAAVSIQRCLLIVRPFTAKKMTNNNAYFFVALTWLYCLIISFPPIFGWNSYVIEGAGTACSVDWATRNPHDTSYIIFIFIMVLAIPLSIIVGSYSLLLYAVKKIGESEAARSSTTKADKRVTMMIVLMISCFLVAWTPYSVFALWVAAGNEDKVTPLLGTAPALFAKACTVYNPIIYFFMNKQFKEALIDWMFCGRNPFPTDDTDDETPRPGAATRGVNTISQTVATNPRRKRERTISCATEVSDIGPITPLPGRRQIHVASAKLEACTDTVEEMQEIPSTSGDQGRDASNHSVNDVLPPLDTSLVECKETKTDDNKTLKPPLAQALKNRGTVTPLPGQPTMSSGPPEVDI